MKLVAEPVLSGTAAGARQLFGATPLEAPGALWGVGDGAHGLQFVHYAEAGGWEAVPGPVGTEGQAVPLPEESIPDTAAAGRTTPAGGVVSVAAVGAGEPPVEDLLVRDPGGPVRAVPAPEEPLIEANEQLFLDSSQPLVRLTAVEEVDGHTGAYLVPDPGNLLNTAVLHYDGQEWQREPICFGVAPKCTAPSAGFKVLAIEAAGPGAIFMLASGSKEGIELFAREDGQWREQSLGPEVSVGALYALRKPAVTGVESIEARQVGQPLTVTSKGVWIDATIRVAQKAYDATIYYDVGEGDPRRGEVSGTWCELPEAVAEPQRAELCRFPLGSDLSSGEGRSFAWPGSGAEGDYGTRTVTGVGQGAILVFENGAWSHIPLSGNGGSSAGAALSGPTEGWLGPSYHLTRAPIASGLQSWPVPFRRPLVAVASQPGAPPGSLSSQALAVGAAGEVARYLPGVGWQPESLLTGSGVRATPDLRAVAWPEPGVRLRRRQ